MTDRLIEYQRIERKRMPIVQNLRQRIKKSKPQIGQDLYTSLHEV